MAENLDCIMSCMVITNPLQTGHPVVFATKGFAEMVGYHREVLLGKSVFQVREMFQTLSTSNLIVSASFVSQTSIALLHFACKSLVYTL